MSNRPHKLPKATGPIDLLVGPGVESFTVGSWCPTVDGSGTPTCVAISIRIQGLGDVVVRIKSPQEVGMWHRFLTGDLHF